MKQPDVLDENASLDHLDVLFAQRLYCGRHRTDCPTRQDGNPIPQAMEPTAMRDKLGAPCFSLPVRCRKMRTAADHHHPGSSSILGAMYLRYHAPATPYLGITHVRARMKPHRRGPAAILSASSICHTSASSRGPRAELAPTRRCDPWIDR